MKKLIYLLIFIFSISCAAPKNLTYFENAERFNKEDVKQSYIHKIQNDDLLSITVNSKSPELTIPFNMEMRQTDTSPEMYKDGYLVSSTGNIVFPILGKINVRNMTHPELETKIANMIINEGYINDPIVTVKLLNYKISVLGEVKSPGMKKITSDRITIFEALSLAGDLTIFGKRDNISIIREENGKREIAYIDINNKDIFISDFYYLQPNDVIYVEPNKRRIRQSVERPGLLPTILSGTSLLVSLVSYLTLR